MSEIFEIIKKSNFLLAILIGGILLPISAFSIFYWLTSNPFLSGVIFLLLIYTCLFILYSAFFNYYEVHSNEDDNNEYIMEYMLIYECKRHENINSENKQIQTINGLIFTGIILLFGLGETSNILFIQGFLIGILGLSYCLFLLTTYGNRGLPQIKSDNRSDLYRKIRNINQENILRNDFAKIFLSIAIGFTILMSFSFYYGYLEMLKNPIIPSNGSFENTSITNIYQINSTNLFYNVSLNGQISIGFTNLSINSTI